MRRGKTFGGRRSLVGIGIPIGVEIEVGVLVDVLDAQILGVDVDEHRPFLDGEHPGHRRDAVTRSQVHDRHTGGVTTLLGHRRHGGSDDHTIRGDQQDLVVVGHEHGTDDAALLLVDLHTTNTRTRLGPWR